MPVYEYRCARCGGEFERYVVKPGTAVACPVCGSGEVRRKLSVFAMKSDGPVASALPSGGCCGGGCSCH